jgi:phosphate transport system substrate-binding protein
VATWGDLGLSGEWQGRQVQAVGRDENSGTRAFFREHALLKGEYKATVQAMPDQWAVVERPATDPHAVSYGPIQYAVGMVKAVPLVAFDGTAPVAPNLENILGGRYPLTRFLYLYVDRAPGRPLDPAVREFLSFVLSKEGQASVASFGAIPLPGDMARAGLAKLN